MNYESLVYFRALDFLGSIENCWNKNITKAVVSM